MTVLPAVPGEGPVPARAEHRREEYVRAESAARERRKAPATHDAYRSDWEDFAGWCSAEGRQALPAAPAAVIDYLTFSAAVQGRHVSTLARRLSGIAHAHAEGYRAARSAGLDVVRRDWEPTRDPDVRDHLEGLRYVLAERAHEAQVHVRQAAPLRWVDLVRIVVALELPDADGVVDPAASSAAAVRDRALLLLGFCGALRRSELVGLDVEDLTFVPGGVEVRLRRSKANQAGDDEVYAVAALSDPLMCPVAAARDWLARSQLAAGPLFPSRGATGRLTDRSVALIVQRRAAAAGVAGVYSGHSLRSGGLIAAREGGAAEDRLADLSGHRDRRVLARYVRRADRWRDPASGRIGRSA